jgi:hypothetical protein
MYIESWVMCPALGRSLVGTAACKQRMLLKMTPLEGLILALFCGAYLGVCLVVQVVFKGCMLTSSCHECLRDSCGRLPLAGLPLNHT